MINRKLSAYVAFSLLTLGVTGCAERSLKPIYSKSAVRTIHVEKASDSEVTFRYSDAPGTVLYAGGVSYRTEGDTMYVVINQCHLGRECQAMVKASKPLKPGELHELRLPYRGGKIVVEYTDVKEQVFP